MIRKNCISREKCCVKRLHWEHEILYSYTLVDRMWVGSHVLAVVYRDANKYVSGSMQYLCPASTDTHCSRGPFVILRSIIIDPAHLLSMNENKLSHSAFDIVHRKEHSFCIREVVKMLVYC